MGAAAVAIGVGRLLPALTGGARWPFRLLGIGYGLLAIAVLVLGAVRQHHVARALREGSYADLSPAVVWWLTAGAVALSIGAVILISVRL